MALVQLLLRLRAGILRSHLSPPHTGAGVRHRGGVAGIIKLVEMPPLSGPTVSQWRTIFSPDALRNHSTNNGLQRILRHVAASTVRYQPWLRISPCATGLGFTACRQKRTISDISTQLTPFPSCESCCQQRASNQCVIGGSRRQQV